MVIIGVIMVMFFVEHRLFTATDVKHYAYCPGIIYVRYVLGVGEAETDYMAEGREVHREKSIVALIARYRPVRVLRQPVLRCPELLLSGVPDALLVLRGGRGVVVEVKWAEYPGEVRRDHRLQVGAYALLARCGAGVEVDRGAVLYLRPEPRVAEVVVTGRLLGEVRRVLGEIRRIASGGVVEPRVPESRCVGCNYKRWCPFYPRRPGLLRRRRRGSRL